MRVLSPNYWRESYVCETGESIKAMGLAGCVGRINWRRIAIALIDNGVRFVSWVLSSCQFQWWNRTSTGDRVINVSPVDIECVEAAILAAFLRHLRAGFVFSASG
jgi:hypothetical protein